MNMKTIYWNSKPGHFVNYNTGKVFESSLGVKGPEFDGTVREWYETLVEQIYLASEGMKNPKVYAGPNPLSMLECTVLFRPCVPKQGDKAGTISGMEIFADNRLENELRVVDGAAIVKIVVNHG